MTVWLFNGVGECEFNGETGDGNGGDGIGSAIGCDCVGRGGSCCGRERLVVREDDLAAVGVVAAEEKVGAVTSAMLKTLTCPASELFL